jgi:hypothetical protein
MAILLMKDPFQEHLHDKFDCGLQVYLQYSVKSILSSLLISASSKVRSTTAAASSLLKFRVPCTPVATASRHNGSVPCPQELPGC